MCPDLLFLYNKGIFKRAEACQKLGQYKKALSLYQQLAPYLLTATNISV